jgi:ATP-dependent helicase HrpA
MPSQPGAPSHADLRGRLGELMLRDERRLRRRLDRARRLAPAECEAALGRLAGDVVAAEQRVANRRAAAPAVTYPPALPVSQARDELRAALRDHQVVVVAGETGSGKTTQLPKLCLELGRGVRGMIGHTQPRRIAARTVAARIAEELGVALGGQVGYQVRFDEQASDETLVKVMTDGILLAEIQGDPMLRAYDTIIVDEAHERSLTIDFLLGYLHQLLPRRRDLKLVVTSATIDPGRFSRHFDGAPVVEVSGRMYPVEIRYRPLTDAGNGEDRDQPDAIRDAVTELVREGPGDILVFLSGEREIRDTADVLRALDLGDTEILPLYARLAAADQYRVFQAHERRRVVLATNVAETSVTVPGIRYVVDPGRARISRYSTRTRVQRLPIERISRASANQRAGRCGRVADGICIRLYDEQDFESRPAFTEPEILRTNLASVILRMAALGLGDVEAFGFVDPPDRRSVRDAVQLLHELGAIPAPDLDRGLTPVGRTLARLPVDPRIGRMIVEADRRGCLPDVLVIAAALSIQDPRERPAGREHEADAAHARFDGAGSDFLAFLELWRYLRALQREVSSSAFRRRCKREFLHYLRVREWQDLHTQLRAVAREAGMRLGSSAAGAALVHQSLLAGLLSHVGLRQAETREFAGAHGSRFVVWPGSGLARKPPAWVMAAELVETSRLWARTVTGIDPAWAEELGAHVVTRTYGEPRWSKRRATAVAGENVTLYGVPLVAARTVPYPGIDADVSRALFLRHALVRGEWDTPHAFLAENRELLHELTELEHRARRRDVVVDEDTLFAFYDSRVPAGVVSGRDFDAWWKRARAEQPDRLTFTRDLVQAGRGIDERDYPDAWVHRDARLCLRYRFEPGAPDDGVTVEVPLTLLGGLEAAPFSWQVPGLREQLVTELVRSLPKELRRLLVPVPDAVQALLPALLAPPPAAAPESLPAVLGREVMRLRSVIVPADAWDLERVSEHLRMTFRVVDGERVLGEGKDLAALRRELAGEVRRAIARAAPAGLERRGLTSWPGGELPRTVERTLDGHVARGFPALVDDRGTVSVRVLVSEAEQSRAMWRGTRRLLLLELPPPVRAVHAKLSNRSKLLLTRNPHGGVAALIEDCTACAVDALMASRGGPAWDIAAYRRLRTAVAGELEAEVLEVVRLVEAVLEAVLEAEQVMDGLRSEALLPVLADARAHLGDLVYDGFVTATGRARLGDVARYLRAVGARVTRAGQALDRDRVLTDQVAHVREAYDALVARRGPRAGAEVGEIRWMIEELRVSLFAQHLGTRERVSEQRILRVIAAAG